jgi:hypothetical protein
MLERGRRGNGIRVWRMAWYLCLTVRQYRELEAGELLPKWEVFDRIDRLFGWPRSFALISRRSAGFRHA